MTDSAPLRAEPAMPPLPPPTEFVVEVGPNIWGINPKTRVADFKGYDADQMHAYAATARQADLARIAELEALINTPQTSDWLEAVKLEAAHQQERWGVEHDIGKLPTDWFWLVGYLAGKALAAFLAGNKDKGLHHIVSTSAALLNWHRAATGEMTAMQPGHAPSAAIDTARSQQ